VLGFVGLVDFEEAVDVLLVYQARAVCGLEALILLVFRFI